MRAAAPLHPSLVNYSTHLHGRNLIFVRGLWLTLCAIFIGLFVLGLPVAFQNALNLSDATSQELLARGISPLFPAYYLITLDTLTLVSFSIIAFILVWHQRDDGMVMLSSATLVATGALYTIPGHDAPVPYWLPALAIALGEILQVSFVFLFPIGKFIPGWMGLLIVPMCVWRPAIWVLSYIPNYLAAPHTAENYGTLRQDTFDTALMLLLFAIGVVAQVYRYRRIYNPIQRLQTKWVLWGILIAIVVAGTYIVLVNALGLLQGGGADELILRILGRTVRQVALFMVPLSLAFSILRYRLWDIDLLLRRTLIYAPLTAILAGTFAALVGVLQNIAIAFTGQESLIATVITTMVIVALVDPLRAAIQKLVKRKFQDAPDPRQQLESFNLRVEKRLSAVRTRHLLRRFADQAVRAFQADGGSAYLVNDDELKPFYTPGDSASPPVLLIDVKARDRRIGAIALGERTDHRPYSSQDRALLQKSAAIVGVAIAQDTVGASLVDAQMDARPA